MAWLVTLGRLHSTLATRSAPSLGLLVLVALGASAPAPSAPAAESTVVELHWQRTGGFPVDGVVWGVAVEPGDPDRIYASIENLGFLMTDDGGATWTRRDPGHHHLKGIFLDPFDADRAYYLQGQGLTVISRRTGDQLSIAGMGGDWGYRPENNVAAFAMDPSGTIYLGAPNAVYRSADKGRTLTRSTEGLPDGTIYSAIAIDPAAPNVLYVGTRAHWKFVGGPGEYVRKGLFRSIDGGLTWQPFGSGLDRLDINAILIHPTDPATLFMATHQGLFRSTDGGTSWAAADEGLSDREVWVLVMDPRDPDRLYAGTWGGGLFVTDDGGDKWQRTAFSGIDLHRDHIFSLAFDPNDPAILYVGTGDGLFSFDTRDGSYAHVAGTVFDSSASYLAIDPTDSARVFVLEGAPPGQAGRDLYRSRDGGTSWQFVGPWPPHDRDRLYPHTYGMQVHVHPTDPSTVYYSSGFGFYESRDGGETWDLVTLGVLPRRFHTHAFAIHKADPEIIYMGTGGGGEGEHDPAHAVFTHMLRTDDGGRTWRLIDRGLPRSNYHIWSVLVHPEDPKVAYMATTVVGWPPGKYRSPVGVYKTVDGGESWSAANDGLRSRDVLALAFHPADPGTLFAAAGNALYVSRDAGGSWESIWSPERGTVVSSIAIDPRNPDVMFAGTWGRGGVYASADGGNSWTEVSRGLEMPWIPDIQHLVIDPQTQTVHAAAGGVFRATYELVTVTTTPTPDVPTPTDTPLPAAAIGPDGVAVKEESPVLLVVLPVAALLAGLFAALLIRSRRRRSVL